MKILKTIITLHMFVAASDFCYKISDLTGSSQKFYNDYKVTNDKISYSFKFEVKNDSIVSQPHNLICSFLAPNSIICFNKNDNSITTVETYLFNPSDKSVLFTNSRIENQTLNGLTSMIGKYEDCK